MVEAHHLPLVGRRGERRVEPVELGGGLGAEETGRAGVQVEEVHRPVGGGVVAGGRAEEGELVLDLLEGRVAVVQVAVVVADGELEADAGVDQRRHRLDEDVVEPVTDLAVVADVPEEGHEPERGGPVAEGHALGDRHGLSSATSVVADRGEREAVGRGLPGVGLEHGTRGTPRDEVLAGEEGPAWSTNVPPTATAPTAPSPAAMKRRRLSLSTSSSSSTRVCAPPG